MQKFAAQFRDWWHWPVVAATAAQTAELRALRAQLIELNQQLDFLKHEVSALVSYEDWIKMLSRPVVKSHITQPSEG